MADVATRATTHTHTHPWQMWQLEPEQAPGFWQQGQRAPGLGSPRAQRSIERSKRARAAAQRAMEDKFIEQHGPSSSRLTKFKKLHSHSRGRAAPLGPFGG